jgi:hypothetical protein
MHTALSVKERLHYTQKKLLVGGGFPALLEMGIFCLSTKKYKDEIYPSGLTSKSSGFNPSIIRHSGIGGMADEDVLNKVQKIPAKTVVIKFMNKS